METRTSVKLVSLFLVGSMCLLGYTTMNAWGTTSPVPSYGLKIDAIPANFNGGKVVIMDFTTRHAGIVVYADALLVLSPYYISSYTTNISSGNFNSNLVVGTHCYASIPVQNATLTAIGEREELENIGLEASDGSVTVSILRNEPTIVQLRINSTSTPTLTVSLSGLIAGDWYQVTMDSTIIYDRIYADANGTMAVSINGPWSSHDLTITDQNPMRSFGQLSEWIIAIGFAVGLFAIIIVAVFSRIKRRG